MNTLSVVVVRLVGGAAVEAALDALRTDAGVDADLEVLVSQEAGGPPFRIPEGLSVRIVELPPGSGPGALRARGIHESRGRLVALTEDHCCVEPGWCAAVRRAHQEGPRVVGGPIHADVGITGNDLAFFLLAYGRYLSPAAGRIASLSDVNVTYRRETLDSVANTWHDVYVETDVHAELARLGVYLHLEPGVAVTQQRKVDMPSVLREQVVHGTEYGRGRGSRVAAPVRFALIGATFVLPALSVLRSVRQGKPLGSRVLGAVPGLVRMAMSWASGERRGYLESTTSR